ncbi:hypothetical protein EMPS_03195 [Entomortierella parvispora]|uniref:Uncharacterized protein n=1 Tax=Entomortierella parvispora TaxID=205924 RepID=A0A9P3H654_9FUNG|nr:hypothetical protein EMPS_03195 [Entomortierella parvispora]
MMKETGTVGKNHFLSYWDIFPLEGPLLSKLQTLRVVSGVQTSLELDRFLTRLGGSCAAKTLQSLTILCSANMPWTVNWTVLRDCVCNLEALEVLKLKYFTIFFDCTDDDNHDENKEKRPVRIAPRVRSLDISCGLDLETKLVVMALFPNIKSLTLAELEDFCEPALDGRLFPNTGSSIDWSGSKAGVDLTLFDPFPRLEFLNIFFSTISGLQDSRLMQYWLQRPTRLRVFGLALFDPSMNSNDGLLSFLCQHAVLTQSLYLKGDGLPWVRTVLTSSVVAEMENLQLTDTRQDLVKLVQSILKPEIPCSEWTLTLEPHIQRQVAAMLPWSRTLKRLSMRIVLDSTQTKGQGTSSLDSMRALLLMLPRLEDLELREAFMDLALFNGLGRQDAAAWKDDSNYDDVDNHRQGCSTSLVGSLEVRRQPMENYCITERPLF